MLNCPNDKCIDFPVALEDPGCFEKLLNWIRTNHHHYKRKEFSDV
jgi:hypothetical protein